MQTITSHGELIRILGNGYYTVEQAAKILRCHRATVYRRCLLWPDVITVALAIPGKRRTHLRLIPKERVGSNLDFEAVIALSKALGAITTETVNQFNREQ